MLKFFQSRQRTRPDNLLLALDIGSDSVKAMLVEVQGRRGVVLGYGKVQQSIGEMHNGSVTDIAGVIDNCQKAISIAEKQAGGIATQMVMGVAGELVKGETITTTYLRPDPHTKIDMAELKQIVQKQQRECYEEIRRQMAKESGFSELEIKHVNAAITGVEIDGQKINNPIGFQGRVVKISIFNAFAPLLHYGALQTIAQELDIDLLAIVSEPYAVARSLGFEDGSENGIFIDVGGGTTDLAVVTNGVLNATKMFMLGGRSFTKRLSHSLNLSFLDAESVKLAYSNDQLEKHSFNLVRESMKSDASVWLSGVELCLADCNLAVLPSKIYLCGGCAKLPEIKESLESDTWYKSLPFNRKPKVQILEPKQLNNIDDPSGRFCDLEQITPMALANIGLELAGEPHIVSKLLNKVVKLMQV